MSPTRSHEEMSPQEKRDLLEKLLKERAAQARNTQAETESPSGRLRRAERNLIQILDRNQKYFPLSAAQQRLWLLDQLDPGNPAYNLSIEFRLRGKLNVRALEQSLVKIM
ncbi:MAG: condensation domain-containing protein, partial [Anaerolineales bacterium]